MTFLLGDIVKFIQHKVNRCNKENQQPLTSTDDGYHDDNEDDKQKDSKAVIGARTPSISAPINRKSATTSPVAERIATNPRTSLLPLRSSAKNVSPRRRRHMSTEGGATDSESEDLVSASDSKLIASDDEESYDNVDRSLNGLDTATTTTTTTTTTDRITRTTTNNDRRHPVRRLSLPSNMSIKTECVDASCNTSYTGRLMDIVVICVVLCVVLSVEYLGYLLPSGLNAYQIRRFVFIINS